MQQEDDVAVARYFFNSCAWWAAYVWRAIQDAPRRQLETGLCFLGADKKQQLKAFARNYLVNYTSIFTEEAAAWLMFDG